MKNSVKRSLFWSIFSGIRTGYGYLLRKSLYSVQIRENTEQKKLRIGTFFIQRGKFIFVLCCCYFWLWAGFATMISQYIINFCIIHCYIIRNTMNEILTKICWPKKLNGYFAAHPENLAAWNKKLELL